tara:strand:- start:198 stop:878 length:681 start_codon:yes stop_codon:yes gene_type:complete
MQIIKVFILTTIAFYSCKRISSKEIETAQEITTNVNHTEKENEFKEGDLIFQITENGQSHAIQFLTKSKYSHVGIIIRKENKLFVFEASNKVRFTPIKKFITSGVNSHFAVKRLKNANQILTKEALIKMKKIGEKYYNKNYDLCFEWTDEYIYCSELVWKIYKEGVNIELGNPIPLKNYDLSYGPAQKIIKKRMARNGCAFSMDELVISPSDMFHSKLLKTIVINQ